MNFKGRKDHDISYRDRYKKGLFFQIDEQIMDRVGYRMKC